MWKCMCRRRPLNGIINYGLHSRFFSSEKKATKFETHYDILNLPQNCSAKDIRNAFIKLSKEYHPDKNKSKESQERFVKISNAYAVLSKPKTRRNYDLGLAYFHNSTGARHSNMTYVYEDGTPWDEAILYRKGKEAPQPYYGVSGIKKMSNGTIAFLCFLFALLGVTLQVFAIRHSITFNKEKYELSSRQASEALNKLKAEVDSMDDEQLIQRVEQRFRESGLYKD